MEEMPLTMFAWPKKCLTQCSWKKKIQILPGPEPKLWSCTFNYNWRTGSPALETLVGCYNARAPASNSRPYVWICVGKKQRLQTLLQGIKLWHYCNWKIFHRRINVNDARITKIAYLCRSFRTEQDVFGCKVTVDYKWFVVLLATMETIALRWRSE